MVCTLWFVMRGVFFFKQKTAYDLRISDWSSDVCSSDLESRQVGRQGRQHLRTVQGAAPAHPGQVAEEPLVQQLGDADRRQRTQVRVGDVGELEHYPGARPSAAERLTKLEEHVIKTQGLVKA